MKQCEAVLATTKLPYGIDQKRIDSALFRIYQQHWK